MGWFMVISLMRFTLWYHFGFCGKLRRGCTYRTENKHVWWTKYDKLLHVQRQGQNISKPIRYWMVTKFTAWYFVHQPTCHGPSGASTLLVLRGRPVRLQTWNGILEPSTEVDCSHLSLTVTMYNMCKRKAKKKTSNYFEQTNTCTVVRFHDTLNMFSGLDKSRKTRQTHPSRSRTRNVSSHCWWYITLTWMIHAEFSPPLIIRPTNPEVNPNPSIFPTSKAGF